MNMRLIFPIRHFPEGEHLIDRRDEERIRRHFFDTGRYRADQTPAHIDRTAAHALENAARLFNDRPGGFRHNHGL